VKVPLGTVVTERLEDFWEDGGAAHTEEDAEGLDEMLEGAEVEDSDSDGTDDGPTGEASDESDESDLSDDDELAGTSSGHSLANRGLAPSLPVVRLSALVYPARALEAARSKDHSSSKADIGPALGRGGKESLPLIDYSVCGELAELSSLSPEEQKQRARQKHRMERRITSKKQKEQHGWILPSPADNAQTFGSSAFGTIDGIAPPQRASVDMDVPGVPLRVAVGGAPGLGNRAYAGTGSSRAKSLVRMLQLTDYSSHSLIAFDFFTAQVAPSWSRRNFTPALVGAAPHSRCRSRWSPECEIVEFLQHFSSQLFSIII
jgi:hypothetical protein